MPSLTNTISNAGKQYCIAFVAIPGATKPSMAASKCALNAR